MRASAAARSHYLSIVIPAYNERERLTISLAAIDSYLRGNRLDAEILVVDDGSNDATAGVVGDLGLEVDHRVISLAVMRSWARISASTTGAPPRAASGIRVPS